MTSGNTIDTFNILWGSSRNYVISERGGRVIPQQTTYYMTPLTKKDNMGGQTLPILRNIASGRPLGSYC